MKLFFYVYITALYLAIQKENSEIVRLLIANPFIDVNLKNILQTKFNSINAQIQIFFL